MLNNPQLINKGRNFPTMARIASMGLSVPATIAMMATGGFTSAGDGGAAPYKRVAADPGAVPKFQSADGAWWAFASPTTNVKQFGAVGDGVVDDTAAIQATFDYASNISGVVEFLPGTYKITQPISIPPRTSAKGYGQLSVIVPTGCDGFVFQPGNSNGARSFRDFCIFGSNTANKAAFIHDMTSNDPGLPRNTGMVFDGLSIANFGTGVYGRGLWNTTFSNIFMLYMYTGIALVGQNIGTTIFKVSIVQGGFVGTGSADALQDGTYALYAGPGKYTFRPENVRVDACFFYGMDTAIHWRSVLYGSVVGCDLDFTQTNGILITSADGSFAFSDNWIDCNNTTVANRGVNIVNLGTLASPASRTVSQNRISSLHHGAGSIGVYVGAFQRGWCIERNLIEGFDDGFKTDTARILRVRDNFINDYSGGGSAIIQNVDELYWDGNYVETGMGVYNNTNAYYGKTSGVVATSAVGYITIPAQALTATASLASLGIKPFPAGLGRSFWIWPNDPSNIGRGGLSASFDGANINVYVKVPFGVDSPIAFKIEMT